MCNSRAANAIKLKEYIDSIHDFQFVEPNYCPYMDHIGALLTDTILQAGVNYRHVVWPRVLNILDTFPYAKTVSLFAEILYDYGTANVLHWHDEEKVIRMERLVLFCIDHNIETSTHLKDYLRDEDNIQQLKGIHGIGNKTCDYLKRLLGFDTVAVDRHIKSFIEKADIFYEDYYDIKEIVEFAADFMERTRRELDFSIWSYMSQKENKKGVQLTFDF